MDAADRIILKALAENARTPIKGLAEKAFLSSPAVSLRLFFAFFVDGFCHPLV